MARSSLTRFLKLAHQAHRVSRATGTPVDEVMAQSLEAARKQRERSVSRRAFLKGTLGAGAVLGVSPFLKGCPPPVTPPPDGKKTVGVVGAGIAGLHAAYRLKKLGVTATVYEAQTRLGGRMFSDRDTFAVPDAQHCELGGELIDTGHQTMLDLATEFGIDLLDYHDDDAALDHIVSYFGGQNVSLADILTAYGPIATAIDADLATITGDGFVTYDAPNNGEALDALSLKAWFDARGIAADNVARQLWDLAFNIEYGLETDVTNCLNMLILTSDGTTPETFALFGESDERFHTANGNDTFITKISGELGAQIETGAKLTAVVAEGDKVRLKFDGHADAVHDHVVIAVPFSVLRECDLSGVALSDPKKQAIAELGYGTNAKLMVGFSTRVWRTAGNSDGSTYGDNGFQATWETSRLQPGDSGIVTNYLGGQIGADSDAGTPEARAATFLAQWEEVFPGATAAANGQVARFHWPTNAFVKGSYAAYKVGQYTTITGSEIEVENGGNLHFCGEHTSLDFQGFMEGAALTGAAAAVEVAGALGVDTGAAALTVDSPEARILARAATVASRRRLKTRVRAG